MEKGDILKGVKTKHPIVFIRNESEDQFIGCFITHSTSKNYPNNIGFRPEHFNKTDQNGQKYEVQYETSFFVNLALIKMNDWGPFQIKGKLTNAGIVFVENYLKSKEPIFWTEH